MKDNTKETKVNEERFDNENIVKHDTDRRHEDHKEDKWDKLARLGRKIEKRAKVVGKVALGIGVAVGLGAIGVAIAKQCAEDRKKAERRHGEHHELFNDTNDYLDGVVPDDNVDDVTEPEVKTVDDVTITNF